MALCDSRQAGALFQLDDDAFIEAAGFLSRSIGEAVPLHDYRASVELLVSALGLSAQSNGSVLIQS